jgi:hypothetical protein
MNQTDVRPPVDICHTCGSGQGYIWPIAVNEDRSHMFVERCDECERFASDFEAGFYVLDMLRKLPEIMFEDTGQDYGHPFIDISGSLQGIQEQSLPASVLSDINQIDEAIAYVGKQCDESTDSDLAWKLAEPILAALGDARICILTLVGVKGDE